MESWKSVVALTVAGVFAVTTAWAQTSTPAPADKPADKGAAKTDKGTMTPADKSGTGMPADKADKADKAARGDMKAKKGDAAMKGGNMDQVRMAQQALKDKGHDPGPIDGKMGAKTKAALKDFQKAQGLKESGQLDTETMAKLEMKTGAAGTSSPSASTSTDNASKPATTSSDSAKPADAPKAEAPKTESQPSASPATGSTDSTKPADATKPAEEKKK